MMRPVRTTSFTICVETFFTDFWATEAVCETAPGDQAALALP